MKIWHSLPLIPFLPPSLSTFWPLVSLPYFCLEREIFWITNTIINPNQRLSLSLFFHFVFPGEVWKDVFWGTRKWSSFAALLQKEIIISFVSCILFWISIKTGFFHTALHFFLFVPSSTPTKRWSYFFLLLLFPFFYYNWPLLMALLTLLWYVHFFYSGNLFIIFIIFFSHSSQEKELK